VAGRNGDIWVVEAVRIDGAGQIYVIAITEQQDEGLAGHPIV
jgi:hypothetical protein